MSLKRVSNLLQCSAMQLSQATRLFRNSSTQVKTKKKRAPDDWCVFDASRPICLGMNWLLWIYFLHSLRDVWETFNKFFMVTLGNKLTCHQSWSNVNRTDKYPLTARVLPVVKWSNTRVDAFSTTRDGRLLGCDSFQSRSRLATGWELVVVMAVRSGVLV